MSVRDQYEVDLAELVEILEFDRSLGILHDPRVDHDHFAAVRGEPEGGLGEPLQLGLALRIGVAG